MTNSVTFVRRLLAVLALGLVTACGTVPHGDQAADAGFPVPAAREVFAAGFENIRERYLEPLRPADIGIEALRGMGSIDPALTVEGQNDRILLYGGGEELASLKMPTAKDSRGWASLVVKATLAARGWSEEMHRASAEAIYQAVFDGMISELDIYSRYAGADEARNNRAKRDGFGGIGVKFRVADGGVEVTGILPETPAAAAGLTKGDLIVRINGLPLAGLTKRRVVARMRGPLDTKVDLTVRRPGIAEAFGVELVRAHIVPVTVTAKENKGVLVLRITSFNQSTAKSAEAEIVKHHRRMGNDLKGVVLDLRGNPGGLLRQSIALADLFLTQGHIITTRGRHPDSLHRYEADGGDIIAGLPLAVLIDGRSASAAEIAAAALQDRNRALVIGTSSYGKGSVQTVIRLPNDGELTMTWSRLITPSGYTLHGLGVHPTICTSSKAKPKSGSTIQVAAAIDRLRAAEAVFADWRRPGLADERERTRLRDTCPAESRGRSHDVDLAEGLIGNHRLFARALSATAQTAQAGGRPRH